MGGNAFPAAQRAKAFRRRRLDIDAVAFQLEVRGDIGAHCLTVIADPGRLGNHAEVAIHDCEPARGDKSRDLAQQSTAVGRGPARVMIWKIE